VNRKWTRILALAIAILLALAGESEAAREYPEKPIKFIIPLEAGSGGDLLTRPLVEGAARKLGQTILVVNKPGASGSIGMREVYESKPDGYTLFITNDTATTDKMQGIFPYNQKDFDFIGVFQTDSAVVVSTAKRPWKTIREMAAYAKAIREKSPRPPAAREPSGGWPPWPWATPSAPS